MLTFSFTGVDGTMTACETLTSGMVGKQVQLQFDSSWNTLSKTVVFRAADVNRVVINPASDLVVIPDAVLARPFGKLFVGVYGTDKDGTVVIPTIMAEGPMIRYGADPIEDETAKELPVWENLQNQIGDLSDLQTQEKDSLTGAVNELHGQETALEADVAQLQETVSYLGEPMLLTTADKTSLVGAINELHGQDTALSGQLKQVQDILPSIGNPYQLKTQNKSTLVGAINELHEQEHALSDQMEQVQDVLPQIGNPNLLKTQNKSTLVGAVNEIHSQLQEVSQAFTATSAQLLINILCKGVYTEPQEEIIADLAAQWGVTVPQKEAEPILFWDFRTGSLTDLVGGITATTAASVSLDSDGAHLTSNNSYIMFPSGLDGASLAGHTLEVKFGPMSLNVQATSLRLVSTCLGSQPASSGISWTSADCWSSKTAVVTEFTNLGMFSNNVLYAKGAPDSNRIDWYCQDQLICSTEASMPHTHISIGSSSNGAHPALVEYAKIYPTV